MRPSALIISHDRASSNDADQHARRSTAICSRKGRSSRRAPLHRSFQPLLAPPPPQPTDPRQRCGSGGTPPNLRRVSGANGILAVQDTRPTSRAQPGSADALVTRRQSPTASMAYRPGRPDFWGRVDGEGASAQLRSGAVYLDRPSRRFGTCSGNSLHQARASSGYSRRP